MNSSQKLIQLIFSCQKMWFIQQFIVIFFCPSSLGDLVSGRCPEIKTSKSIVNVNLENFCADSRKITGDARVTYAFLPFSKDNLEISPFSFDFNYENKKFNNVLTRISCVENMKQQCFYMISVFHNLTQEPFSFFYNNPSEPYPEYVNVKDVGIFCRDWDSTPSYKLEIKVVNNQFMFLWGCQQINMFTYDRGLIFAGPKNIDNASEIFKEALIESGLMNDDFWDKILFNDFGSKLTNPEKNPFYFPKCWEKPWLDHKAENLMKIVVIGIVGAIFVIVTLLVIIFN